MPGVAPKSFTKRISELGLHQEEFEGPRYRRIHHIKYLMSEDRIDQNLRWIQPVQPALV